MNIHYGAWWSISLDLLRQHFFLGFPFLSYSSLLALQTGNAVLLKQNTFYYYQVSQYKVAVWVQPTIKHVRSNEKSISPFLPPLYILTRVTSLKQVMYDFGQSLPPPLPVYVRYGWFLIMFILLVFALLISLLHPTFTLSFLIIIKEGW